MRMPSDNRIEVGFNPEPLSILALDYQFFLCDMELDQFAGISGFSQDDINQGWRMGEHSLVILTVADSNRHKVEVCCRDAFEADATADSCHSHVLRTPTGKVQLAGEYCLEVEKRTYTVHVEVFGSSGARRNDIDSPESYRITFVALDE